MEKQISWQTEHKDSAPYIRWQCTDRGSIRHRSRLSGCLLFAVDLAKTSWAWHWKRMYILYTVFNLTFNFRCLWINGRGTSHNPCAHQIPKFSAPGNAICLGPFTFTCIRHSLQVDHGDVLSTCPGSNQSTLIWTLHSAKVRAESQPSQLSIGSDWHFSSVLAELKLSSGSTVWRHAVSSPHWTLAERVI